DTGRLEVGCWADMLSLDTSSEHIWGRHGDTALDAWVFAGDDRLVTDVWSAGRHMVRGGRHVQRANIVAAYKRTIDALKDAL
ncbi:MAG: formimidoylglutamate deiminase, partial [Planktomarina sp.]